MEAEKDRLELQFKADREELEVEKEQLRMHFKEKTDEWQEEKEQEKQALVREYELKGERLERELNQEKAQIDKRRRELVLLSLKDKLKT